MSEFDMFGDESTKGDVVTYGIVLVPRHIVASLELKIRDVFLRFGGSHESRIHCRELLHDHARAKTCWAHLEVRDALDLIWSIALALVGTGVKYRLGLAKVPPPGTKLTVSGHIPAIPLNPKQIVTFAYTVALCGLEIEPWFNTVRFWRDPDATKIEWGGGRRRQAGNHPVTFEGGVRLVPEPTDGVKPLFLDVADILAYSSAQAFSTVSQPMRAEFGGLLNCFNPVINNYDFHPPAISLI